MAPLHLRRHSVLTLLVVALATTAPSQDEAAFVATLATIQSQMKAGDWQAASKALTALLDQHRERAYVLARRLEIEEDVKRCAFRAKYPAPDVRKLIRGKLLSWTPQTGRIKLVYDSADLADFTRGENDYLGHPVVFGGPYSIEFEGKLVLSETGLQLFVCQDRTRSLRVVFGYAGNGGPYMPASVTEFTGATPNRLASKQNSPVQPGKPFTLRVDVKASSIVLVYNGRAFLTVDRPKDSTWGSFGFHKCSFSKLTIEGQAQPSWLQGVADAAQQAELAQFNASWKAADHLPAWLLAAATTEPKGSALDTSYPGKMTKAQGKALDVVHDLITKGELETALAKLASFDENAAPPVNRAWCEVVILEALGRPRPALERCDLVCSLEPGYLAAKLARARLLFDLRRRAEALEAMQAMIAANPAVSDLYREYIVQLLLSRRRDEARAVIDQCRQRPDIAGDLQPLHKMLVMAEKGPAWAKTHEFKSKHYHIVSDIDQKTCMEAARVLEESWVVYNVRLADSKLDDSKLFRVFLFSGEASYKAYVADILGELHMHTAGLYSSVLEQLLIWNLPDRADMLRTIRHEGFHQFLDRIVDDAPVWFDEGMAEYYESAQRDAGGRLQGGQIRDEHLLVLRHPQVKLVPLQKFVDFGDWNFYANPRPSYAQAWAFIHFLRQGPPERVKRFEAFFDALQQGKDTPAAIEHAFAGVDWPALDAEFARYVREAGRK